MKSELTKGDSGANMTRGVASCKSRRNVLRRMGDTQIHKPQNCYATGYLLDFSLFRTHLTAGELVCVTHAHTQTTFVFTGDKEASK